MEVTKVNNATRVFKIGEVENFPFLVPSPPRMIADGYQLLAELGAVDLLPKPIDSRSLRSAVDRALQRDAAPDATERLRTLDEGAFHARHIGVVTTKLEEKIAELESANAELRRGELRLRDMLGAMAEFR